MAAKQMDFDYFSSYDSEQFQFIRIPKIMLTDARFKALSFAAKGLYGLLLDRVGLSKENGWLDESGRVYIIYTIEQVADAMGCGRDTAMKLLAELDTKSGIGLIERVRQGRGKPDLIYVKNFCVKQEVEKSDPEEADIPAAEEVEKTDFKKSENPTSGGRKNRLQEVEKIDPNKTYINQTESRKTDLIHPSMQERARPGDRMDGMDGMDGMDEITQHTRLVKKNIEYEILVKSVSEAEIALVNEIVKEMVEVLCSRQTLMKIGDASYPLALVRQRMLELRFEHIQYVLECLRRAGTDREITNIKAYRMKTLFNAPATISSYYQAKVNYDMGAGRYVQE